MDGLIELADAFFIQGEDWRSAEEGIVALRNGITEVIPEYLEALAKAAEHEVAYVKALWRGDAAGAATSASQVVEALAGGQELAGTGRIGNTFGDVPVRLTQRTAVHQPKRQWSGFAQRKRSAA